MFGSLRLAIVGAAIALSAAPVAADSGHAASRQKQPGKHPKGGEVPAQALGGRPVLLIVSRTDREEEQRIVELLRALPGGGPIPENFPASPFSGRFALPAPRR